MDTQAPKPSNLAARMGRWSADHWKTATFGWIAFVLVAFALGGAFGTKMLDPNTAGPGESGRADRILDAGFKQPAGESVLVQSDSLRVDRRGLHRRDRGRRRERLGPGRGRERPLPARPRERGPDLRGRPLRARRVRDPRRGRRGRREDRPGARRGGRRAEGSSGALRRRVRRRQLGQGDRDRVRRRPREGRSPVAAGHARHPRDRVRGARGRGHSAAARPHRGLRRVRPRRAAQPHRPDGAAGPGDRAADRARGRRRLLALLPAPRPRGAGRGTQRAGRCRGRRRHVGPLGARLRADRDRGDGGDVPDRRPDLRVVRHLDDHRRRHRDARLPDRAPRAALDGWATASTGFTSRSSDACAATTARAGLGRDRRRGSSAGRCSRSCSRADCWSRSRFPRSSSAWFSRARTRSRSRSRRSRPTTACRRRSPAPRFRPTWS